MGRGLIERKADPSPEKEGEAGILRPTISFPSRKKVTTPEHCTNTRLGCSPPTVKVAMAHPKAVSRTPGPRSYSRGKPVKGGVSKTT